MCSTKQHCFCYTLIPYCTDKPSPSQGVCRSAGSGGRGAKAKEVSNFSDSTECIRSNSGMQCRIPLSCSVHMYIILLHQEPTYPMRRWAPTMPLSQSSIERFFGRTRMFPEAFLYLVVKSGPGLASLSLPSSQALPRTKALLFLDHHSPLSGTVPLP